MYFKRRYASDPEFRERLKENLRKWREANRNNPEYKEKQREASRQYYHNHEDYRQRRLAQGRVACS